MELLKKNSELKNKINKQNNIKKYIKNNIKNKLKKGGNFTVNGTLVNVAGP